MEGIAAASTNLKQAQVMQQFQTQVLSRQMDFARTQGQEVVDLVRTSTQAGPHASTAATARSVPQITDPMLGNNVDLRA